VEQLLALHRERTGESSARLFQAPGRVNLLGEHTDYSGGFCMPAALNFNTLIAATPRSDRQLRLHSIDYPGSFAVELGSEQNRPENAPRKHWSSYCAGVAWSLAEAGIDLSGADLSLSGNVPQGAGLSSSASVEVATATALLALANTVKPRSEVALLCQRAENIYVGAPCGIMDQFISASGVKDHALAIDTRNLTAEPAPIPATLKLVVCNSMVRHSVGGGEYGQRRREVEDAALALHRRNPAIVQLRDATLAELEAAQTEMSREAFLRGRHVITDSQRVLDGVACLRAGDLRGYGALMTAAHASFRDDFVASCAECDLLVELALPLPGCLGSRLTGGGFGGCTVSLVEENAASSFAETLQTIYLERTGVRPDIFVCEVCDGAGELPPD
jgi:galactokinase